MVDTFQILLKLTRALSEQTYTDEELLISFEFLMSLDNDELKEYVLNSSISTYKRDIDLYIQAVNKLIEIFEEQERYELCWGLKQKKELSIELINK